MGVTNTRIDGRRSLLGLCLAALLVLMVGLAGCGADDTAAVQSCTFHSDCPMATICSFEQQCETMECGGACDGDSDLVCLVNDEYPEGTCSRKECVIDDDCDTEAGESCHDGICATGATGGCEKDSDCGSDEQCNLAGECVPDDGGDTACTSNDECLEDEYCDTDTGECAAGDCFDSTDCEGTDICDDTNTCVPDEPGCEPACAENEVCDDNNTCVPDTTDPCGGCASGETCDTTTNTCVPAQTCEPACTGGQICDSTSGTCIDNNCPAGTPSPDDCTGAYDKFNPDGCYCAQCLTDNDCDTANGETCNPNGECMKCNESCDPSAGGNACSNANFYCVSECCVECLGAVDCPAGQVCVDGSCGSPPDCSVDPTICTGGTVCDPSSNTCVPQQTDTCSSDADCDQLSTCNTQTGQCESITGGNPPGGGTCDPACPANTTCTMGMFCTGCSSNSDCPSGNLCMSGACFDCAMLAPELAMFCDFF